LDTTDIAFIIIAVQLSPFAAKANDVSCNENVHLLANAPRNKLGESREAIIKILGKPLQDKTKERPNYHGDLPVILRTLEYPNILIVITEVPHFNKSFLEYVKVTANISLFNDDFEWGLSKEKIIGKFGKPASTTENRLHYNCFYEITQDDIYFYFEKDRLISIEWVYFND
jgi:hypothetical protein